MEGVRVVVGAGVCPVCAGLRWRPVERTVEGLWVEACRRCRGQGAVFETVEEA